MFDSLIDVETRPTQCFINSYGEYSERYIVHALHFSKRWKLIPQRILQTSANTSLLKMRFNKQELLTLATQPSQKFEKEGILYVRERQEGFFRRAESEYHDINLVL